jgi:glycosyltransferase involved in cell wall biosynthesis
VVSSGVARAIVVAPARPRIGGLGTAAADFHEGLEELGVETRYIGRQPPTLGVRLARSRPVHALRYGLAPRLVARSVRRAVPERGWDLAYAIGESAPVEKANGRTVVIHQARRYPKIEWEALRRAARETGATSDFSRARLRRCEWEIDHCDLIHVTTRAVRDEFLDAGVPPERLVHAYLGVDVGRFRPAPKPDGLRIGYVGALSMRKGVDIVADLACRLRGQAEILAVGGPNDRWSARIVAQADFTPRASVPEMLAESHVMVLPSRSDAFAYVVLEALACGAVPIVTPQVGASEIVRELDARLVVPLEDYAERVVELLPTLDLAVLSSRGVELAQRFERRKMAVGAASAVLKAAESIR